MASRGLLFRHGTYYARLVIPEDARPSLDGKREFRERLGTDKRQAERDVHGAMDRFHRRVAEARKVLSPANSVPGRPMSLAEVARAYHARALAFDDGERQAESQGHGVDFPPGWSDPYRTLLGKVAARRASDEEAEAAVGWAIQEDQAKLGTEPWRRLAQTLAAAQLDAMDRQADRDAGNFGDIPKLAILDPAKDATPPKAVAATPRALRPESLSPLREFVHLMHAEKTAVRPSTRAEQITAVRFFEEWMGGPTPAHAITRRDLLGYKEALQKTPVKYATRFPGRTLPEAIKANAERKIPHPVLSATTINGKWLSHLQTLFAWAVRNDYLPDNPAQGVRVDLGKADAEPSRVPFTGEEMRAILASPDLLTPSTERAWGVLVAAFTGMRVGEVAQLRLDGIVREDGVLVFQTTGELKNAGSRRSVPVHGELLSRGLDQRITALRAVGEVHLFPEWMAKAKARLDTALRNGKVIQSPYGDIHAHWFVKSLLASASITDKRKRFHSLRHTFKTALARAGVPREISDAITGHADHTAGGRYIHAAPLQAMAEAIAKVSFG